MDGLWLAELRLPAYIAAVVTLATGGMLPGLDRMRGRRLNEDMALNSWMWMKARWLASDGAGCPVFGTSRWWSVSGVGAVLLANAIRPSCRHRRTLRSFRKIRVAGR